MKEISDFEQLLEHFQDYNDDMRSNKEFKDLQTSVQTIRKIVVKTNENKPELYQLMTIMLEQLKILSLPIEQLEKTLPIITELDGRSII